MTLKWISLHRDQIADVALRAACIEFFGIWISLFLGGAVIGFMHGLLVVVVAIFAVLTFFLCFFGRRWKRIVGLLLSALAFLICQGIAGIS